MKSFSLILGKSFFPLWLTSRSISLIWVAVRNTLFGIYSAVVLCDTVISWFPGQHSMLERNNEYLFQPQENKGGEINRTISSYYCCFLWRMGGITHLSLIRIPRVQKNTLAILTESGFHPVNGTGYILFPSTVVWKVYTDPFESLRLKTQSFDYLSPIVIIKGNSCNRAWLPGSPCGSLLKTWDHGCGEGSRPLFSLVRCRAQRLAHSRAT